MKFFRLDLLTLLISLFLLNSCKNQDSLGLVSDPSQQISGSLIDTATLQTNTVLEDSVLTSGLIKTPLAYFKDPVIGTSVANIAMSLGLPSVPYSLPSGTITIDSAVLVLRYNDGFYGDSLTSKYKANVYQLAETPVSGTNYYSTKTWSVSNNLLGSLAFNSRTHTRIQITDIVTGKPDTLKTVNPQLRIKLTPSFFASNLFNASAATLASTAVFQSQLKGLYLTLDKTQQQGNGGRFYIRPDSSRVDIYYKAVNPTTAVIDTAIVSLPLSTTAAEISRTYSSPVTTALSSTSPQETFYLDGMGGLRTKLAFPYIKNILNVIGPNTVINRAELVITPVPGSNISYPSIPRITLYRLDIAKQRTSVPDAVGGSNASLADSRFIGFDTFGGVYNSLNNSYTFVITGYISDLIRGKTVDYGTYIAPIDNGSITTSILLSPTAQVAARTYAVGGVKNTASANYPYRMKLNIIYTKPGQ